ncbi:glycoside hydrolase family 2 protein [Protaetiibacter intestinalis]|uniref:Glycoside hydrolase family 2 n=1 Tax=Protaetiibacter intestinalis TaxID=2419774 RepID=A0A387B269_9MICO|nr:sugar-binding domain-containing protein [Protaetiibacter intestinalis]AYF97614.1 glycoside hydrolase family 2 [Protaetiibacter intestinalis]
MSEVPHPEYPRPQLRRAGFTILNGWWRCAFTPAGEAPSDWGQRILVPFSPEAELSGVGRQLQPHESLWYRRRISATAAPGRRTILHFGAVDQTCRVLLDGVEVAAHTGGYLPFSVDITDALGGRGEHELVVEVRDVSDTAAHSVGKQRLARGGIWYTAQSGIWQTVWLEEVPTLHVAALRMRTPGIRAGLAEATLELTVDASDGGAHPLTVAVLDGGERVAEAGGVSGETLRIRVPEPRPWSPDDPHLYDLEIALGDDRVTSYVGLRSVEVAPDTHGVPRLHLNGAPYPHLGVLDQGYWPDGLYTAPDDAALVHDIRSMKELGFTMLRKHIKIEPLRWYHHCDRLGVLVWQDMVNGGERYRPWVITTPVISPRIRFPDRWYRAFGRADAAGREEFLGELDATVELLRNVPSVVTWVPFNEGWGQFDAATAADRVRALDDTRVIDQASGWHDQRAGDLRSLHVYFQPIRPARWWGRDRRALVVSEFGGYSLRLPGHRYPEREFGYRRLASRAALTRAYERLHRREVIPAIARGLSATVYTQLSDVEDESNGLLTADRGEVKLDADAVRALNADIRRAFAHATLEEAP